jgi:2,4-dienoyl-CoA reductase-like NADH-dependent reductase (Old Yellow Enzyme family)
MTLRESFLADVEAFLSERRIEASLFGRNALKDPNFVFDLRKGRCPNLRTIQRVREFMLARASKPDRSDSSATSELGAAR